MFGNYLARHLSEVVVLIDLERHGDIALELYCDGTEELALLGGGLKRLLWLEREGFGLAISIYLSVLLFLNLRLLGLARNLGLLGLASLVALAIVLLSVELLGPILVVVVLAIAIVRVVTTATAATLSEASSALASLVVRVLLLLIGLRIAVPLLSWVQRIVIGLALILPIVLLAAPASLVAGVVVGASLLARATRLLLVPLAVRCFIIIICHIVTRRVLGLLPVVTLPVLVPRVVLITLVLVSLVLTIVTITLVASVLVVGALVGPGVVTAALLAS